MYTDPSSFNEGFVYASAPTVGYGFTDSIPKAGHHLFVTLLHYQAVDQLADLAVSLSAIVSYQLCLHLIGCSRLALRSDYGATTLKAQ